MSTPLRTTLRLTLCLLLSTLFVVGHAQRYILNDQEPFLSTAEATHLMQSLDTLVRQLDLDANRHPVHLFTVEHTIYATADGHSYLWKWERDSFRNIYQGYYHGYNFGGYHFAYRGHLYSYGGYGYWQFMPFLTYFDWETNGWEIRPFGSEFPRIRGEAQRWTMRDGHTLYVALTEEKPYLADRKIIPIESDNFHRLDLETNTWELLGTIHTSLIKKNMARTIETEHYVGFFNNYGNCAILKKDSLLLKSGIPLSFTPLSRRSENEFKTYSFHIKGDSITVFNDLFYALGTIDLKAIYQSSGLSTELFYEPNQTFPSREALWLGLPFLLLFVAVYWWYRSRRVTINREPTTDFPYCFGPLKGRIGLQFKNCNFDYG
jgi:hypothetical protein